MSTIVQIVPRLKPVSCGIGDYALGLADEWRSLRHFDSMFIVGDPLWKANDEALKEGALAITSRNSVSLVNLWKSANRHLLLQYSGYGYARRGAPVWLVAALKRLRRDHARVQLTCMVHELYALGPPTTSSFWFSPLQRWVTAQVAKISDTLVTNRQASAAWLEERALKHRGKVKVLPVFSNLGEAAESPPPSQRENHLVLFGYQAQWWGREWDLIRQAIEKVGPSKITILGRESTPNSLGGLYAPAEVVHAGWLEAKEISAILRTARYGLLAYDPAYLGKSGIFAAFAAHRVVPLLVDPRQGLSEGLAEGRHLLKPEHLDRALSSEYLDKVANAVFAWYQTHNRHTAAEVLSGLFCDHKCI